MVLVLALFLVPAIANSERVVDTAGDGEGPTPSLSLDDLKKPGTRIAILTALDLENTAAEIFPDAQILEYDTFADVFNALDTGKPQPVIEFSGFCTKTPLLGDFDIAPEGARRQGGAKSPARRYWVVNRCAGRQSQSLPIRLIERFLCKIARKA